MGSAKIDFEMLFLFALILLGIFFRLYNIGTLEINGDEEIIGISAVKLVHSHSYGIFEGFGNSIDSYDPRLYLAEHPPVARFIMGLPTLFMNNSFEKIMSITPETYIYNYAAVTEFREVLLPLRLMSFTFGILAIIIIFLFAKDFYSFKTSLIITATASLSFILITLSRLIFMDVYSVFFIMSTLYFYSKYSRNGSKFFLFLAVIFFAFSIGSRNYSPLPLIIMLPAYELFYRNNRRMALIIFSMLALVTLLNFLVIYPPEIFNYLPESGSRVEKLFAELDFIPLLTLITGESLVITFLAIIFLIIILFKFDKKKDELNIHFNKFSLKSLKRLNLPQFAFLLFLVFFSLTAYYSERRGAILIPLFILSAGYLFERFRKNPAFRTACYTLLLLNCINLFMNLGVPTEIEGQGFDITRQLTFFNSDPNYREHEILNYLNAQGNPSIITNDMYFLLNYNNSSLYGLKKGFCYDSQIFDYVKSSFDYVVYEGDYALADAFLCENILAVPNEIVLTSDDLRFTVFKILK